MMTLCCVMLAIFLDLVPILLEANISIENIHEVTNSPSIPQPKGRKAANACQVDWIFCTSRSLGWQHRCFPKTRNRGTQKSFKAPYEKKISYWWLKNMFIWLLDDNPLHNTNNVDQWYPYPMAFGLAMTFPKLPMDTQQLILHCLAVPAALRTPRAPGHHWTIPADRCERTEGCSDLTWDDGARGHPNRAVLSSGTPGMYRKIGCFCW